MKSHFNTADFLSNDRVVFHMGGTKILQESPAITEKKSVLSLPIPWQRIAIGDGSKMFVPGNSHLRYDIE
ncbi:MAG: hypothetical protein HQM08_29350 [Candidatus Riflebacteria bacterium]|nr:hypothetical protein [Candidatus Riflebacteria bacterium]